MIRVFLLVLALAAPAAADTVRVLSGEHGSFTRLVVELQPDQTWTVGRTADGYGFAAEAGTPITFDLSAVFKRIARTRITDIETDSATGALFLKLGCDCHVFPFEYRGGIIVLDIKEGPAPAGSAFEAAFRSGVPSDRTSTKDEGLGAYDWLSDAGQGRQRPANDRPLPLDTGAVSLEPLRDELLEEIARGAAAGVVQMELPGRPTRTPRALNAELPWSSIRIGEAPGVIVSDHGALIPNKPIARGCPADDALDLAAWGEGKAPLGLLADARNGLFGEFDSADEIAILRSARQLIFLGYGAEARQTLALLSPEAELASLYRSMSALVDGEADPQSAFAGMLDCEGAAAFWAALAHDPLPPGPVLRRDAILKAYQSLPAHLRIHLGPALAERFILRDDIEAARIIRNVMDRAPNADPADIALLDAKSGLKLGQVDAAQAHAKTAVSLGGDQVDSLVTLVEAHLRKLDLIDSEIPETLLALRKELGSVPEANRVDRAIVLSLALSGQIAAAFQQVPEGNDVLSELWHVTQVQANDDDFLQHAVLPAKGMRPAVAKEVAVAVAERLLALGFADAALVWLGPIDAAASPALRLTVAKSEIGRGNGEAAVAALWGAEGKEAEVLRAKALLLLGDTAAAAEALASAGEQQAAERLELWTGNWASLDSTAPPAWREAAGHAQSLPSGSDMGLLGRGAEMLSASDASRGAIAALLASVPSPTGD